MRKPSRPPTPPTAVERGAAARVFSRTLDGEVVSLSREALKEVAIHGRDAASASRRERRRMAAIMRSDRVQARLNKAIQRQLDKVEKRAPPPKIRVSVEPANRRPYRRKPQKITPRSRTSLPAYDGPIIDRQGRRGVVMTIDYDGAKRHAFGIIRRRIIYISDPEHCEIDAHGRAIFFSNLGEELPEVLMAADLAELTQRESRADAKLNVNIIVQMPHDVSQELRAAILKAISHELFGRHGLPYAAALHEPDPNGDERNYHGHICGSWRPVTRISPYCWEVAQDYRSDLDGKQYWRHARRRVAEIMTSMVQRDGLDREYTHLSNAERGLVHKPQIKLDKRKTRAAREGEFVADVEANRRRIAANVALEKKLEEGRRQRRERALKRRLAVLAKLELALPAAPQLQPVSYSALSASVTQVRGNDERARSGTERLSIGRIQAEHRPAAIAIAPVIFTEETAPVSLREIAVPCAATGLSPVIASGAPDAYSGILSIRSVTAGNAIGPADSMSKIPPVQGPAGLDLSHIPIAVGLAEIPPLRPVARPAESGRALQLEPIAATGNRQPIEAVGVPPRTHNAVHSLEPALQTPESYRSIREIDPPLPTGDRVSSLRPMLPAEDSARSDVTIARLSLLVPANPAVRPLQEAAAQRLVSHPNTLHALGSKISAARPTVRLVGLADPVASASQLPTVAMSPSREGAPALCPVLVRNDAAVVPALQQTMDRVGALMNELATGLSRITRLDLVPGNQAEEDEADHLAGESAKRPEPSNEPQDVAAARAFVERIRNKAIQVEETEAGLIVPHSIYWPRNGLTERGLRDPTVQEELVRIRRRQVEFMNRITPILQAHIDARILLRGRTAMVDALPENERAEAGEWARTGIWSKAMEWLGEEGRERSRIALDHWKEACEKESVERFAEGAKALRQHERWPLDLEPRTLAELRNDAAHHVRLVAARQAAARDQGLG